MTLAAFDPPAYVELPNNFRMAYREWGQPTAERSVVLVHGITSSSLSWVRVGRSLADRYRVLAVDLKGHGDTDKPTSGYKLEQQAEEVVAFCRALNIERPYLVGHSWGGAIGLIVAATANLVERLVLEDPALGWRAADLAATPARPRPNYVASVGLTREQAEAQARPNLALGWTEEDVAGKIDAAMKGSATAVQAVFDENGDGLWNLTSLVPKVSCPSLLVRALPENGGVVSPEPLAAIQANPHFQIVTLSDADHNIHRGRFEAFMAAVRPFLDA